MSSNLFCVPYMPEHIELMAMRDLFQNEGSVRERVNRIVKFPNVYAVTVMSEEGPIAVIGLTRLHEEFGDVWSVTTDAVKKYPLAFVKLCRRLRDTYEQTLGLRRLQISVREGYQELIRWAEAMGFEREALMKNYGQGGTNYFLYSRTR